MHSCLIRLLQELLVFSTQVKDSHADVDGESLAWLMQECYSTE
jgi:hypothetical protein